MKKIILLEGADGAGKTTAHKALIETYKENENVFFWTLGPIEIKGDPVEAWKAHIQQLIGWGQMEKDAIVITDRSFIGNLVYGRYKKDQVHIDEKQLAHLLRWLERIFDSVDIFHLRCTDDTFMKRLQERGDDYIRPWEAPIIQREYDTVFGFLLTQSIAPLDNVTIHAMPLDGTNEEILSIINGKINEAR